MWLFTFSDLKTIVGPKTVFGIVNASFAPVYGIPITRTVTLNTVLLTTLWVWMNLIPFVIDNQRQQGSIMEDRLNKPWRPMPSKRLSPSQAKRLMFILYITAFGTSVLLGGLRQNLSLMVLGFWYNDCGGAAHCVARNFINACGFVCFASGAMEVALGTYLPLKLRLVQWFLIIGGVVFSTVQLQDMYDQAGDRICGRKTLPIALGDWRARLLTALPLGFWCLFCPWIWSMHFDVSIAFMALGSLIIFRTLFKRQVKDDKITWRIWVAWIVFLYLLPLIKYARHM